jgi:hypothetical protein
MKSFSKFLEERVIVKKDNYRTGDIITITKGKSYTIPLHPKHQKELRSMNDGDRIQIKVESGHKFGVARKGDDYIFTPPSVVSSVKTKVKVSQI